MEKVRLGIAGPGRIVHRVMTDLRKAEHIEIAAVASRSLERARAAQEEFGLPLAFGSYEEMAASPEVDLVYVAVPHPFHHDLALLFLNAGKHVIVEKPFAINGTQAREMADCARKNGRYLMEAMWTRFFPLSLDLKRRILAGELGDIRRITGDFSFRAAPNYEDRLFNPALGGGSLLDVGIYPLSLICYFKNALPEKVQVLSNPAATGVDGLCSFQVGFKDGSVGQGFAGLEVTTDQAMKIYGTLGWVEIPDFWHPTRYTAHLFRQPPEERTFDPENEGFHHEFEYAAQCILQGETTQDVMPLEETIALVDIMDGMRAEMGVRYSFE